MTTATAVLAALGLFTAGCSAGGDGVKEADSGPSTATTGAPSPQTSPSGTDLKVTDPMKVDAVGLLRRDPKVRDLVRQNLKPCNSGDYPVDISYGYLTGGTDPDVVVNVLTCTDGVGVGTYVYRPVGARYENVFQREETTVNAEIDGGDLVVTEDVYEGKDSPSEPYAEDRTTYRWTEDKFARLHFVRDVISSAVGQDELTAPDVIAQNGS
ncbi:hypothetical protein [Streptomyces clavuligerus]|uniref:hypothetical protein n=1 Tax=Streptomyces clavuligerus TaxID=1901 RepID=UPI0027DAAEBD|nr:hypothetical protein [Streptomyces clavuligerus]